MADEEEVTYEIRGYRSQEDFDNGDYGFLEEGYINLHDVFKDAGLCLITHPIVKVQSEDREEIHILKRA